MKKMKVVVSATLVIVLLLGLTVVSYAATNSEYYRCNGANAGTYRSSSHSFNSSNCDIMIRRSYCTLYRNGVAQGTQYHTHDHYRYHTQSGCPGGSSTICTHGSSH